MPQELQDKRAAVPPFRVVPFVPRRSWRRFNEFSNFSPPSVIPAPSLPHPFAVSLACIAREHADDTEELEPEIFRPRSDSSRERQVSSLCQRSVVP